MKGTVRELRRRPPAHRHGGRAGREADRAQRGGRAGAVSGPAAGARGQPRIRSMQALTARQERILCKVVEDYLRTGQPVASKSIAADPELDCRASTVRGELALLEEGGLLAHPHVSAGRVPTDAGQRYVVDRMLASGQGLQPVAQSAQLELSLMRREVEEAVRSTTETLSQVTNLLAVVSAPALNSASIRHVEVLALQSRVVMVVIITSTGSVSKMMVTFERARRSRSADVGGGVSERAACRNRARRAHAAPAPDRPGSVRHRDRVSAAAGAGVRRDRPGRQTTRCMWRAPRICSRRA